MNIALKRSGSWATADTSDKKRLGRIFDEMLSYALPGAEHSQKFKDHIWDGRVRLHQKVRRTSLIKFPSGMVDRVSAGLKRLGHTVTHDWGDDGPPVVRRVTRAMRWVGHTPYPHQADAVAAVLRAYAAAMDRPMAPPGCILKMPIRSGKTLTAAKIVSQLGGRTVFVAPTEHLMHQTWEEFSRSIEGASVGMYGAGHRGQGADIVIATYQTLAANAKTKDFEKVRRPDLLVLDEAHHKAGTGKAWRDTIMTMSPNFTMGLSATFSEASFEEGASGDDLDSSLWLRGVAGPIAYTIPMATLVDQGFLTPTTVIWTAHGAELIKEGYSWPRVRKDGIVESVKRNREIVRLAGEHAEAGRSVLIDTGIIGHTRLLNADLKRELGSRWVAMAMGSTGIKVRREVIAGLRSGRLRVVVGTIFGEGVDVPELDVVINAEGQGAATPTIQRVRCMTPAPGKEQAYMHELIDDHHPTLKAHCAGRMDAYMEQRAFEFRFEGEVR